MRREAIDLANRLILRPIADLVDVTEMVAFSPRAASQRLALNDANTLSRAVPYFVAAFTVTIVLNRFAYNLLGIDALDEVIYWAFHVGVIAAVGLLAYVLGAPFRGISLQVYLSAAQLAYGASFLLGGVIVSGAALIIWGAQAAGYIPSILPDFTAYDNFMEVALRADRECLLSESIIYRVAYHGLGGPFENLNDPIDDLSYVYALSYLVAPLIFLRLLSAAAPRRRAVIVASLLSTACIYGTIVLGLAHHNRIITETSTCTEQGIETASQVTAEDQARIIAGMFANHLPKVGEVMTLLNVEAQKRSVIFRYRFHKNVVNVDGFRRFAAKFKGRQDAKYCSSELGLHYQKLGISMVSVIQYGDTEIVENVAETPDQCIR